MNGVSPGSRQVLKLGSGEQDNIVSGGSLIAGTPLAFEFRGRQCRLTTTSYRVLPVVRF